MSSVNMIKINLAVEHFSKRQFYFNQRGFIHSKPINEMFQQNFSPNIALTDEEFEIVLEKLILLEKERMDKKRLEIPQYKEVWW